MLQAWQTRVIEEYNELIFKLNALTKYLETHEDTMLSLQHNAMTQYAFILSARIDEFQLDE